MYAALHKTSSGGAVNKMLHCNMKPLICSALVIEGMARNRESDKTLMVSKKI
ncbi:hypothetical protein KRR38_09020 [Novosphingobium sp. G106]|uniref:hypothetical protein n=1 Tax=Novosphingobium sp. G106 TaxID=2849500 RepID=UPI001C2D1897|nr:hypothetical protein [Novosphingobium sp. G106]MBV1687812.1 hypothetical protein [Novosphingobium sp. G106]